MKKFKNISLISWFVGIWFILTAVFLYFFWPIIWQEVNFRFNKPAEEELVIKEEKKEESPEKQPEKQEVPNQIVIPKIGISAPLVTAKTYEDKDLLDALNSGIAHYPNTPVPGEVGNIFVTGHSSNYRWAKGDYNYVFSLLNKLEAGDAVVVYYNGVKYKYVVFDVIVTDASDVSVMKQTSDSVISLMTCDPPGTTWKRRIVRARQIEPDPKTNKEVEFVPVIPDELVGN